MTVGLRVKTNMIAWPYGVNTVQSLYNMPCYNNNMNLDIKWSCCGSQFFNNGILQRNYRKLPYGHFPVIPL